MQTADTEALPAKNPLTLATPEPKSSPRLKYHTLDAWRGVAALAIVFLHSYTFQVERAPSFARNAAFSPLQYGYLGVELFFVISGYCIAAAALSHIDRREPVRKFIMARLRRILPPYWAACLLFVGSALGMALLTDLRWVPASQIAHIVDISRRAPLYFAANATLTQIPLRQQFMNPVAWTLGYELAFYAIFALAIAAMARRGTNYVLLVLHALTAGVLIWQICAPRTCPFPFDMWPQFGIGVLLFDYLRRRHARTVRGAILAVLILFAAFILVRDVPIGTLAHSSRIAGSVVVAFAVLLATLHPIDERLARNPAVRALGVVGAFSYSLYLINFLALGLIRQETDRLYFFRTHADVRVLFQALATVGIGYLFYLMCEKPLLARRSPRRTSVACFRETSKIPRRSF